MASTNVNKLAELAAMLKDLPVELLSLEDFPDAPQVQETGTTFEQNAAKKASEIALYSGLHAMADDSGLCVEALDGAPGVRSARYAGPNRPDVERTRKVLRLMRYTQDGERAARFECHIALADPEGSIVLTAAGTCDGLITRQMRGGRGFGYDPIFLYPPAGKTFAQMTPEEKNKFSHRARAIGQFRERLIEFLHRPGSDSDAV